jgi:hypothetical protein
MSWLVKGPGELRHDTVKVLLIRLNDTSNSQLGEVGDSILTL